ncbi:MAG: hypothetical protein ONB44_02040 [candidate division KSB1 bacterium]|nr:hypothetical protein [candidate division KSB1 bacterium]
MRKTEKKITFWMLLILIVTLVFDTMLYFTMFKINETRNLFYDRTDIDRKRIEFWLKNSYNPILGWDLPATERNKLGARGKKDYPIKDVYKIKTFGDSFTYGAEVEIDQTWQSFVEMKTGWDCLNYGVGGFGTDQAFLKYKMNNVKTEYTILGILCENIGRTASVYPAFYMREWAPPKPRFVKQKDTIRLIENPISNPDSAFNLLDKAYLRRLKKLDYWPYYYEKILHSPPKLTWPALYVLFSHLPFFLERVQIEFRRICCPNYEIESQTYKYLHLYEKPTEIFQTFCYIIDQFVFLSHERGEYPIILVFPDQFSLDLIRNYGITPYQPLIDFLNNKQYDFLDFGSIFTNEDYESYYNSYNSHFSPKGNSRVADELISFVREFDAKNP